MSVNLKTLRVVWSIVVSLIRVRSPRPRESSTVDHHRFAPALGKLAEGPPEVIGEIGPDLAEYLEYLGGIHPDQLSRDEALAYWINLYNAGALLLAGEAWQASLSSVMRIPGAFDRRVVVVAGEHLSLNDIEHAKVRRFGDPRIHAALVCGSVSCPTLRGKPFTGDDLDAQLDDQLRYFLSSGGYTRGENGMVWLNRIFLWYSGDFVRPHRMPTFRPAPPTSVLDALPPGSMWKRRSGSARLDPRSSSSATTGVCAAWSVEI